MKTNITFNKYSKCPKEIINNKKIVNCSEIFLEKQFNNFFSAFFPTKSNNIIITYLISALHILSLLYSVIGLFMKPKYLILYSVYMALLLSSLIYYRNNCFLTLFKNYFTRSNKYPIHLKEITTTSILSFLIIYSLIAYIFPTISLYNISNVILNLIYNYSSFISKISIIIFLIMSILFALLRSYIKFKVKKFDQ